MERRKQAILLALPASLALLFFFILPMVYILIRTLTENGTADFTEFFTDPFYLDILWTTIRVSLVSTAVSLLLGYPTAYYMARTTSRLKQAMVIVILFPFLVSAVVRSYGWMVILGTNGLLNQLLLGLGLISEPLKLLNTEAAVIIGSEGSGVSPELLARSGQTIKIPMRERCESLNAAAAAAIVLWEMARNP